MVGWNYLIDVCSITTVQYISYDGSGVELVVTPNNKPNYLVSGLGYLLIGCAIFASIYYNFDKLKTEYTYIDLHLYNTLCLFGFPGFMVNRLSTFFFLL